ncbi:MAG: nicotinamide riboside transporter PnuC [Bacteroidales bacterium]|nr:nicotinamide riboside transporter PnuC [Bacteroidales bacterium]
MKKLSRLLYREFVEDADVFYWLFLVLGIATQIVTYWLTDIDAVSLLCGMCGILSVLLCSRRKISNFVFGFIQVITYFILAYQQRLYGELAINLFYFFTMIYGCVTWAKSYDEGMVETKKLSLTANILAVTATIIVVFATYRFLSLTNDSQPFMDALTTVPAITAEILMVTRFRQQWWYWIVVDVASMYMWFVAGNWCMVAQYFFWTANCVYGLHIWKRGS